MLFSFHRLRAPSEIISYNWIPPQQIILPPPTPLGARHPTLNNLTPQTILRPTIHLVIKHPTQTSHTEYPSTEPPPTQTSHTEYPSTEPPPTQTSHTEYPSTEPPPTQNIPR